MYPVTIIKTRYGGAYEGGEWAAFNCGPQYLPWEINSDDITCTKWWGTRWNRDKFGVGNTPQEAYEQLLSKVKNKEEFVESQFDRPIDPRKDFGRRLDSQDRLGL